jgi:hypothetical protein
MAAGKLRTAPGHAVLTCLLVAVASAAYDGIGREPVTVSQRAAMYEETTCVFITRRRTAMY